MVLQNRLRCHYAAWIRSEIWLQKRPETIIKKGYWKSLQEAVLCWTTRKAFLADEFHSDASKHWTFSVTSLRPIFWTPSAVRTKSELPLHSNKPAKWGRQFHTKHTPSCNVILPASDCLLSAPPATTAFSTNILTLNIFWYQIYWVKEMYKKTANWKYRLFLLTSASWMKITNHI